MDSCVPLSRAANLVSLRDLGMARLVSLCRSVGSSPEAMGAAVELFDRLVDPWEDYPVGDGPPWPNDITDDGTPFEFSLAFAGDSPLLRMLVEPQQWPLGARSGWNAGVKLQDRLEQSGLIDCSMFNRVHDLFSPPDVHESKFTLWHAGVVESSGDRTVKVYVNPQVHGASRAPRLVKEALIRLELKEAWRYLEPLIGERAGEPGDIRYFSVDLRAPEEARVKIYLARSQSASEVERIFSLDEHVARGEGTDWVRHLTGFSGPYTKRPLLSCLSFRQDKNAPSVTMHVPIRCYVHSDTQAIERISGFLSDQNSRLLQQAVESVGRRPTGGAAGVLTYASLRRERGELRTTVYLAPELYTNHSYRKPVLVRDL